MIVRQRAQIICNHLRWGGRALRMRFVASLVPKCEGPGAPGNEWIRNCGWVNRNTEIPNPI